MRELSRYHQEVEALNMRNLILLASLLLASPMATANAETSPAPRPSTQTANTDAPVQPEKLHETLKTAEVTSADFPQLRAGFIEDSHGQQRPAVALQGEEPIVWRFSQRILTIFQCEGKPCVNDASGKVYQLRGEQWHRLDVKLRPWTTLVDSAGSYTGCIKPTVVRHSGVQAYCYAVDRSWRQNYMVRSPHPEICGKSLRLIQQKDGQTWLLDLALPSGKINSKIAVKEPFKPVCDYKGPIKPASTDTEQPTATVDDTAPAEATTAAPPTKPGDVKAQGQ